MSTSKSKLEIQSSSMDNSNSKEENQNITINKELYLKMANIEKYYSGLIQLISIYFKELENYLENKDKRDEINSLLSKNKIHDYIKKYNHLILQKNLIKADNIEIELVYIYDSLITIHNEISNLIGYIKSFNIYDEITLLSDTSKNNINQNKIVILDMYNKLQKKNIKILKNINEEVLNNYNLTYESYFILHDIYLKNSNIIELYTNIIKNYLYRANTHNLIETDNKLSSLILFNNQLDKNKLLTDYLITLKNIKRINDNNLNDFKYLFKDSKFIKNKNIVTKFTNFTSYKKYLSIHDLFLDIQNSNFKFKSNDINKHSISIIQNIVNDYYKIERQYLNITLIEIPIEKFNYNCFTLLNSKFALNKNIGINNKYINKTKTIITEEEYKYLEQKDLDYKNEMYLSYFNKMININNFQLSKKKSNHLDILLESQYILIIKLIIDTNKFEFHIMKNNDIYMNFNNIKSLLQNKPDYIIENYNLIRNEKIINNIEENNMLNLYQSKIASDYKNLPTIDNLELKNLILNNIKKSIKKIDQKSKETNINKIINIITDELYKYIKNKNNIEFSSEIYLTYYSNIHKLINKIKKELTDNYNLELLDNLDIILNNLYSNIITINYNVLDKYYLTQL